MWQQYFGHLELKLDASDRRFNPADIFWLLFFPSLSIGTKYNSNLKWIQIKCHDANVNYPYCKVHVCMPMGRCTQETENQVVIYYKKKEEIATQFNKSFVHTYIRKLSWVSHFAKSFFFFFPRGHRHAKGDLRYSRRLGRWPTVIWVSIYALYRTYFPFRWKSIFYLFYVQHTAVMPQIDNNVDYICDTIIPNIGICMKSSLKKQQRRRLITVPVSHFDRTIIFPDKMHSRRPDF